VSFFVIGIAVYLALLYQVVVTAKLSKSQRFTQYQPAKLFNVYFSNISGNLQVFFK